jgi:ATP-dependent DNA helicase RecQ
LQSQLAQTLAKQLPKKGYLPDILKQEPQAEMALAILHTQGQLVWVDPFHYRLESKHLTFTESSPQTSIEAYLSERSCRWRFLLGAFGFGREAQGLRCGGCDSCCNWVFLTSNISLVVQKTYKTLMEQRFLWIHDYFEYGWQPT